MPESFGAGQGSPAPFFFGEGAPVGVLLIHGWSGSPAEMRGLGRYLADHGMAALGLRLPGHGHDPRVLFHTRWTDWAGAAGQALDALRAGSDTVFVVGLSMGAVLALYLGATVRPPLAGVVALAPPIYLPDRRVPLLPIIKYVLPWYTKGPASPRDPTVPDRLWQYPRLPSESILQMYRLGRETRRLLPRLQVPLLVGRARHDATVPPRAPALVYHYAGSADKTLLTFEHSGHILTEDADRDAVWARVRAFVEAHSPAPAAA